MFTYLHTCTKTHVQYVCMYFKVSHSNSLPSQNDEHFLNLAVKYPHYRASHPKRSRLFCHPNVSKEPGKHVSKTSGKTYEPLQTQRRIHLIYS